MLKPLSNILNRRRRIRGVPWCSESLRIGKGRIMSTWPTMVLLGLSGWLIAAVAASLVIGRAIAYANGFPNVPLDEDEAVLAREGYTVRQS